MAIGRRRTARPVTRDATGDIFPELDLLPATFDQGGVAPLETSRGCTNYCSFCPRGHNGLWAGTAPGRLPWMLAQMSAVFDRYPQVSRTLYLEDEEFIGRNPDAAARAVDIARAVCQAGLQWESSCRVDQVIRPGQGIAGRAGMWRTLMRHGLRIESGVDSVLDRFNTETTGEQNALTIRTVTALGVPTRFTYITFDQLMPLEELKASHAWQGRTDLLLRPQPHLSDGQVARAVRDEDWVARKATGQPLHTSISYMLVSMECLTGAATPARSRPPEWPGRPPVHGASRCPVRRLADRRGLRLGAAVGRPELRPQLHLRAFELADLDLTRARLTVRRAARTHVIYLDEITLGCAGAWLRDRHGRWPRTANPHLFISRVIATDTVPVSYQYVSRCFAPTRITASQLREDRILDEARHTADPVRLVRLFGISGATAMEYVFTAHPERQSVLPR
jgi:hypothetical protein